MEHSGDMREQDKILSLFASIIVSKCTEKNIY